MSNPVLLWEFFQNGVDSKPRLAGSAGTSVLRNLFSAVARISDWITEIFGTEFWILNTEFPDTGTDRQGLQWKMLFYTTKKEFLRKYIVTVQARGYFAVTRGYSGHIHRFNFTELSLSALAGGRSDRDPTPLAHNNIVACQGTEVSSKSCLPSAQTKTPQTFSP